MQPIYSFKISKLDFLQTWFKLPLLRESGFSVGLRRSLARKVEVGRYSADTPNNPRQGGVRGQF